MGELISHRIILLLVMALIALLAFLATCGTDIVVIH